MKRLLRRIGRFLLSAISIAILLVALYFSWFYLVLFFVVVLAVVVTVEQIGFRIQVRRFASDNEGITFLVFSRRHGWYEFVTNNVQPALPNDCVVVWYVRSGFQGHPRPHTLQRLLDRRGGTVVRPVAVRPTGCRLETRPLRHVLQPFKLSGAAHKDASLQAEIARALDGALNELRPVLPKS